MKHARALAILTSVVRLPLFVFAAAAAQRSPGNAAGATNPSYSASWRATPPGTFVGPSTSVEPYIVPMQKGVTFTSLLTVGDSVPLTSDPSKKYRLVGIPDGMGAYLTDSSEHIDTCQPRSRRDSSYSTSPTFNLLMNHEIPKDLGAIRRHGAKGAFVSEYIIDRKTYEVISGEDLIKKVVTWDPNTSRYNKPAKGPKYAFDRFCSADLPVTKAFYDAKSGKGTTARIYMNGEEITGGRAWGHVASGSEKGYSYELPALGKASWENQVACPHSGQKTVVVGLDDSNDGQVYIYIGHKQKTGKAIDKAGLTNGKLYGIRVRDFPVNATDGKNREPSTQRPLTETVGKYGPFNFDLRLLNRNGDVCSLSDMEEVSDKAGVTRWFRPEDGTWKPVGGDDGSATFYFATTASFTDRSRMWKVVFKDISNPVKGGTITAVVEGSEEPVGGTPKMMDNMVATCGESVYLQEDPGKQDYLARIWRYHPKDDLILLAQHNPKFFAPDSPHKLTTDEESSGIMIPADAVISRRPDERCFLLDTQAHFGIPGELVEGGQLMLMCVSKHVADTQHKQPALAE